MGKKFKDDASAYFYFDLTKKIDKKEPKVEVIIRKAMLKDILFSSGLKISLYRALTRGDEHLIAKKGNKIVSRGSICYRRNKAMDLDKDEAALISFLTDPDFRRQGLYVALMHSMFIYLKKRGFKKAYIWANKENLPSLKGIEKGGFIRAE
ncbi:MAG: GNAT family N-acetyltransferase [archaeon]